MSKNRWFIYGLLSINLLIILAGWWFGTGMYISMPYGNIILTFGRLFGLLAVFFVLMQFLLIGREVWLERLFGLDKLASVHRINGYLSMGFILAHFAAILTSDLLSRKVSLLQQIGDYLKTDDLLQAAISVVIFLIIVGTSIVIARKKLKYEGWYFVHLLTYLAVLLAWGHQLELGGDFINTWFVAYWYFLYIFVLGNFVIFRFLRPLWNFWRFDFVIGKIIQETADTWSIYIEARRGNLDNFRIRPGQFLNFRFLQRGFWWQSHPFSVSNLPSQNQFRITVKASGDLTSKIAQLDKGTRVFLEGPFGLFTALRGTRNKYLFIAGGVGIAPIRSLIEQVAPENDLVLLYSNKTLKETIFAKELENLAKKYRFKMIYILTDDLLEGFEKGRLDLEKLRRLVSDLKERQIYLCGPTPMMNNLIGILKQNFGISNRQIHYDKFSLT